MLAERLIAAPRPGTVIDGRYRVERLLGAGGMGAVVAAADVELRRDVAIKVLLPKVATSEEAIARFSREGRAAARLASPYAAKVFDTGRLPSGEPYLVMELLYGSDLATHLAKVTRVPLEQALEWALQAAHALGEAHRLDVIHRDVKPANLFLAETSVGTIVKVLDFGVSKLANEQASDLTNTASILGTPRYMAPEQMRSARLVDRRCDVWSLGVVLYELTTGASPFRGESVTALCFDVMERTPLPPSHHDPSLPAAFDECMARCLAKDPDERFSSMDALADALRALAPHRRFSLVSGSIEVTPAPVSGGAPPISGAAVASPRLPSEATPVDRGLSKWLVGAGLGIVLTGLVALGVTAAIRSGPAAPTTAQSAAPAASDPVRASTVAEPAPSPSSEVEVVVAPSSAPPIASMSESAAPSAVPSAPSTAAARRIPAGPCDPPTWRDANNRLVPKPYCL